MARLLIPSLRSCFISGTSTCGHWPPMRFPVLSGLINSRLHPVPQNIPFKFRKHGQHACESAAARGSFARVTKVRSVAVAVTLAVTLVAYLAPWRVAGGIAVHFWNVGQAD